MLPDMKHEEHSITSVIFLPEMQNLNVFTGEKQKTQNETRKKKNGLRLEESREIQVLSKTRNPGAEMEGVGGVRFCFCSFIIKNIERTGEI